MSESVIIPLMWLQAKPDPKHLLLGEGGGAGRHFHNH